MKDKEMTKKKKNITNKNLKDNSKKKNSHEKIETKVADTGELKKLFIIILAVIFVLGAFYLLTIVIDKLSKDNAKEIKPEILPVEIQYEEILIGTIFNQPRNEYYVLTYENDDYYKSTYLYLFSTIAEKNKDVKLYRADFSNEFNKKYVSDTANIKVSNLDDFRIKGTTLLKIKNKSVVEYWEGNDAIITKLKSLVK